MIYFSANLVHKIIFSKISYMTSFGLRGNIYVSCRRITKYDSSV